MICSQCGTRSGLGDRFFAVAVRRDRPVELGVSPLSTITAGAALLLGAVVFRRPEEES